ncbi:hypothetical protein COV16_00135 [Candidatus Woesearchaeota archaeon CG10_big_fil_rev_8_21_14_0_10_34_8]|nr:MAG: hypothetical protein COV16_00135 [Candidatus Woesearchaeota archaeon CG10_big_fil_rev_8_21_14_0_10_34_8]
MITKDNNLKIMEIFYKEPNRASHIRELARETGLSSTGVIKIVKRLKKEGLLKSKKEKMVDEIRASLSSRFYMMKRLYNIFSLYECGIIEEIKNRYEEPDAIVLFGSYEKGTDTDKSDIDICVISRKETQLNTEKFARKLKRAVNIITLDIDKATDEFRNSIANGTILEGYAELIR